MMAMKLSVSGTLTVKDRQRFPFDPNQRSGLHPEWIPADLAPWQTVEVGDRVFATQVEPGEPDFIGEAWVKRVDRPNGLVYLKPEWETFHDEVRSAASFGDVRNHTVRVSGVVNVVSSGSRASGRLVGI